PLRRQEGRRNVAAVRRGQAFLTPAKPPISFKKIAVARLHREGRFCLCRGVDIWQFGSLYTATSARRRLGATARLRSSSLRFAEAARDSNRRPRASTALRFTPEGGTARSQAV